MSERVRLYHAEDAVAVREVHLRAFGGREDEPHLVGLLHAAGAASVSLVAAATEPDGRVVGHVLFSPVHMDGRGSDPPMMVGLASVGVLPEYQGLGIGSRLIREGLAPDPRGRLRRGGGAGQSGLLFPVRLRAGEREGAGQRVRRGRILHGRGA